MATKSQLGFVTLMALVAYSSAAIETHEEGSSPTSVKITDTRAAGVAVTGTALNFFGNADQQGTYGPRENYNIDNSPPSTFFYLYPYQYGYPSPFGYFGPVYYYGNGYDDGYYNNYYDDDDDDYYYARRFRRGRRYGSRRRFNDFY